MIIYYSGSPDKPEVERLTIFVAPAALIAKAAVPEDWWNATGDDKRPREFAVDFYHGEAEVEDRLGAWMIEQGMARKSRLIIPPPWQR